jgi:hypothetical protein
MNVANRFINRLTKIGIDVELTGNYPWVYLWKVNGVSVNKTYMAEHGFTAFWQPIRADQEIRFSDRREVFKMIRKMIDGNCS